MTAKAVWTNVLKGLRLQQPYYCPDIIYGVMNSCWLEYSERPSFEKLLELLVGLLNNVQLNSLTGESHEEILARLFKSTKIIEESDERVHATFKESII